MVGVGGSSPLRRTKLHAAAKNFLKIFKKVLAKASEDRYNARRCLTATTKQSAFSSAWLEHHLDMVGVSGSSPLRRTNLKDWQLL